MVAKIRGKSKEGAFLPCLLEPALLVGDPDQENTLNVRTRTSETPHRMTLYLKLHNPPQDVTDYHLQAEVFQEKWLFLQKQAQPWHISLAQVRLMLM